MRPPHIAHFLVCTVETSTAYASICTMLENGRLVANMICKICLVSTKFSFRVHPRFQRKQYQCVQKKLSKSRVYLAWTPGKMHKSTVRLHTRVHHIRPSAVHVNIYTRAQLTRPQIKHAINIIKYNSFYLSFSNSNQTPITVNFMNKSS